MVQAGRGPGWGLQSLRGGNERGREAGSGGGVERSAPGGTEGEPGLGRAGVCWKQPGKDAPHAAPSLPRGSAEASLEGDAQPGPMQGRGGL